MDHRRGQGRSCPNGSQGQSFKDDWVMHLSRKQARNEAGLGDDSSRVFVDLGSVNASHKPCGLE